MRVGVELRVALPRTDALQFVQASLGVGHQGRMVGALGQRDGVDGHRGQAAREPVQVADLAVDGGAAEVLEQVVVDVHAVEGGRRRLHLVAPGQVVSRKVREGLSRSHALARN